ncbi:MAG: penicillin-binding protein 2, partial [Dolichospermum sp.]
MSIVNFSPFNPIFAPMAILPPLLSSQKNTRTVGRGVQSTFIILLTLLMLSGIGARLVYLQIVQGEKH